MKYCKVFSNEIDEFKMQTQAYIGYGIRLSSVLKSYSPLIKLTLAFNKG